MRAGCSRRGFGHRTAANVSSLTRGRPLVLRQVDDLHAPVLGGELVFRVLQVLEPHAVRQYLITSFLPSMPKLAIRYWRTASARFCDSARLHSALPLASVCPAMRNESHASRASLSARPSGVRAAAARGVISADL